MMKKLNLNKETVSQMDKKEMATVNGGVDICLVSCAVGSRKGKKCCDGDPIGITIEMM